MAKKKKNLNNISNENFQSVKDKHEKICSGN